LASDHRSSEGRSLPVSKYDDMPRGGVNLDAGVWHTEAQDRMDRLKAYLRPHERVLLAEISRPDSKPWDRIISLGTASGYKTAEQMRAAGVAYVQQLLESVAQYYFGAGLLPNRHSQAMMTPHELHAT
jgi:hypothetical protein